MEKLIIICLLGIAFILFLILYGLVDLHNDLKKINETIIDIHPEYKYKKVYESKKYKQNI